MYKSLLFFVAILFFLFLSTKAGAQAPTLGTAAGFVIFSSTGAVSNTGTTSQFTGNAGTLSGAITIGVNVNGVLHNADAAASAAAADILLAYQQLQLTTPTDTQFGAVSYSLGNHDTLQAGVDSISLNTLLTDTLVLDGQNNANALFIFKINGTFASTTGAAVTLINGALACNVFWQVAGAISSAANTALRGTFITQSAAIDLGSGTRLEGRALTATAGAITTNNVLTYLPTGCGSPVLTGPAAPVLGAAACYALFTGNGANTNSGITYVTGDIGTNVDLTMGYDPLLVTGMIHPAPDASTAAAASDLLTAYTYLNTLVPDIELLYPALFGQNLVLTPHTYLLNSATALTDTLYLNAEGNADAVFVLQINGALSTGTYATVVLTNGAQAKNVFWKVDGATTINDYSVIKGTIVGNNGAVNLNTGVQLDGRALTTNGAFSAAAITATIPPLSCIVPLPVSLVYFRGTAVQGSVLLQWGTAYEQNNDFFTIEKSRDALIFEKLTTVKAISAADNMVRDYSFTDNQPYGLTYYRLAQTDKSGRTTNFKTIAINNNSRADSRLLPYVENAFIHVAYANDEAGDGMLVLYSIDGRKISSQPVIITKQVSTYSIARPLQSGIYMLFLERKNAGVTTGKVMVD